jgi:hypothetical protein
VCAVSEEEIRDGEEVYLVLTNWKLFDNCWVRAAEVDRAGWESCLKLITSKFQDFVKIHQDFQPYRRIFGDSPSAKARSLQ